MIDTSLNKALLLLENDLDARGWDQPATLYEVHGDFEQDPTFVLLTELPDPRHDLDMIARNARAGEVITGLVLATEAWRPLTYDEAIEAHDEELDKLIQFIQQVIMPAGMLLQEIWGDKSVDPDQAIRMAWVKAIVEVCDGEIHSLPERWRREVRTLIAVNRSGRVIGTSRVRGGEPEIMETADAHESGLIPELLAKILGT